MKQKQIIGKDEILSDNELCNHTMVKQQIDKVIEIAKTCDSIEELKEKINVNDK